MSGNVRVGPWDSLISRCQFAESKIQQAATIRRILEELDPEVAEPNEAQEVLASEGGHSAAF